MANPKSKDEADRYLDQRPKPDGYYYYQRKIPSAVRAFDKRGSSYRVSLKTKSLKQARDKRDVLEAADDKLWASLLSGGNAETGAQLYAAALRIVEAMGFGFKPADDLAKNASLPELQARWQALGPVNDPVPVEIEKAILGNVARPVTSVQDAYDLYVSEIAASELAGKSEQQRRKWRNVKRRGVDLFIEVVGNLDMEAIEREHGLKLYRHWQALVAPTGKGERPTHTASSGNRDISTMRTLYKEYFKHIGQHDRPNPFAGLSFKERGTRKRRRLPFAADHIQKVIMKPDALARMNGEARAIMLALIETGCRPSEICNIQPSAIRLSHAVPHIAIEPRDDRELKSEQSEREIPLVGVALEVFKKHPNGFPRYQEKEESLSAVVNKFLRENELMPSPEHTLYGFRHSFEDRMKEANLDSELRALLMGHKISREEYGQGGKLAWRQAELQKIALPFEPSIV